MHASVRPPLEIGLVLAGRFDSRRRQLVLAAGRRLERDLAQWFPNYAWRIDASARRDIGEYRREESSELLRQAAEIRDAAHQDFVLLVTPDELIARYRAFALAALSRPLDAAVLSTARLVPELDGSTPTWGELHRRDRYPGAARSEKASALGIAAMPKGPSGDIGGGDRTGDDEIVIDRLATLMLHALAHLAGQRPARDRDRLLHRPDTPTDLDAMTRFEPDEIAELDAVFGAIADTRLEESGAQSGSRWRFTLRAATINRGEIGKAVLAARPWEFPQRLSRLSTAAVSTLAILLMTAESWDLGLSRSWTDVLLLALVVLALTTTFVVHRQQLLLARHRLLREQLVVTRISALLIVVAGLATTWLGILVLALLAASTLFDASLIASWAASHGLDASGIGFGVRARMATFCASIGLLIGSLGASFEDQHHFRHVIFVDEEL